MLQRGQRVKILGLGGKEGILVVWEAQQHGAGLCTPEGYAVLQEGREAPVVGFPAKDILEVVKESHLSHQRMVTAMKPLSQRQQAILDYVRRYWRVQGYAPSIRDIVEGCELSSTSVVDYNLNILERLGLIRRERGKQRTIREA